MGTQLESSSVVRLGWMGGTEWVVSTNASTLPSGKQTVRECQSRKLNTTCSDCCFAVYPAALEQERCIYGPGCPGLCETLHPTQTLPLQQRCPPVSAPTAEQSRPSSRVCYTRAPGKTHVANHLKSQSRAVERDLHSQVFLPWLHHQPTHLHQVPV